MAALMSVADNLASPESVPQPPNNPSPTSRSPPTTATNVQQRSASRGSQHSPNSSGSNDIFLIRDRSHRTSRSGVPGYDNKLNWMFGGFCRVLGQEVERFKARLLDDRDNVVRRSGSSGCRCCWTSIGTYIKMHPVSRTSRGHALRSMS